MDDLDTGLGWDDLGSMGTNTGTPSTSKPEWSRQQMSDPTKPTHEPIIEEEREESPFESKGLKNMEIESPTPKIQDEAVTKSPVFGGKPNTDRRSPDNVTPDNWRVTPTDDGKMTPKTSRSGQKVPQSSKPGSRNGGYQSPANRNQDTKSPGNRSQGNRTPGNRSQGNVSPSSRNGNQTNRSQNNTQRNQDSGLDEV